MPRRKLPRIPGAILDQLLAGADAKFAFDRRSEPLRPPIAQRPGRRRACGRSRRGRAHRLRLTASGTAATAPDGVVRRSWCQSSVSACAETDAGQNVAPRIGMGALVDNGSWGSSS